MDSAGVATADQTAKMLETMTLDSQNKGSNVPEDAKKPSDRKFGPLHRGNAPNGQVQRSTKMQPGYIDQSVYYANNYPYFYKAYDGTVQDWDDYRRYCQAEGVEVPAGAYGDNVPLMYNPYVYPPYAPYSPAASPGSYFDAKQYAPRQYQRIASHPSMTTNSTPFTPGATVVSQKDVKVANDQTQNPVSVKPVDANELNVKSGFLHAKASYSNPAFHAKGSHQNGGTLTGGFPASGYQDPKFSCGNNAYRNQNMGPQKHLINKPMTGNGAASGLMNSLLSHPVHSGFGYISNGYDSQIYGQGWLSFNPTCRPRGQGNGFYRYGYEYADGLNELNRGPRAKLRNLLKTTSISSVAKDNGPATEVTDGGSDKISGSSIAENVNLPDFPVDYADAKFFIIKSYSEDDVHKSVKYNVWASTPNGNKKLDAAYKQAQEKSAPCPVFLFFSVNASGQFVGVAEMVDAVDFDKNLEYWQQDKWNGCFPLKWHIVKDVPNTLLKHIIIQSNENKPVTNSRDTQEVNLEQGLQMLKIFKEHSSRTSIIDDFEFYESRQKAIQEKKVRIQFQKQVWEGKAVNLKSQDEKPNPLEAKLTIVSEQNIIANGDSKEVFENGFVAKKGDGHKVSIPVVF